MSSESTHELKYRFEFDDGRVKEFIVRLDAETLALQTEPRDEPPAWTRLENFACANCPLDRSKHTHCPVAVNLGDLIEFFSDSISHTPIQLVISTADRTYSKKTSLQSGVSSLIGIYMPTSGCPILEKLKPMVRFHLPFATLEESKYRVISMFLVAQYLREKAGLPAERGLDGLVGIYEAIRVVNLNFCEKLTALKVKDATLNAVSILDSFADFTTFSIDYAMQDELEKVFAPYLTGKDASEVN